MEATRTSWWVDLLLVGAVSTVPAALIFLGVDRTALRLVAGLPLVLFLPGYALVSALFPEAREDCDPPLTRETGEGIEKSMRTRLRGLTGIDRLGLSVALSVALTPGIALFHYVASGSFEAPKLAVGLTALTWAFVSMALGRRLRLPADHRFGISLGWPAALYERYFVAESPHMRPSNPHEASSARDVALNVLLVGALLVALTTAAYAFTQPPSDQRFDELAVLTQDDDGEYVAANYPEDLSGGQSLHVAVVNQREYPRDYVLRGALEVVDEEGNVVERDVQTTRELSLSPGERTYVEHDPEPTLDGERLRLRYTLTFAERETDGPHRSVYVWIQGADEGESTPDGGAATPTATPADGGTPTPAATATPTPDGGDGGANVTATPGGNATSTPTATDEDDGGILDV